jgi:hypothetical protein
MNGILLLEAERFRIAHTTFNTKDTPLVHLPDRLFKNPVNRMI